MAYYFCLNSVVGLHSNRDSDANRQAADHNSNSARVTVYHTDSTALTDRHTDSSIFAIGNAIISGSYSDLITEWKLRRSIHRQGK
jgi:hypothetical protein